MAPAQTYFPNVNLLRALAALLVLVYHVIELGPWPDFPTSGPLLVFRTGWIGVDLFFVISGFVIGLSAMRLYRDGGRDYRRTFMRRRLARIVPLYLLTSVAFLVFVQPAVLTLPWPKLLAQLVSHLLFLHNLHPATHGAINGPNWSVAAEMQFYVLVVLAVPYLSRIDVRALLAGGVLIAWLCRALAFWATRDLGNPYFTFVYSVQVPSMLDAFAIGLAIARLHLDGTLQRWMSQSRGPALIATAFVFTLALDIVWQTYWSRPDFWGDPAMVVFWRTGLATTFGALVLFASLIPNVARFLRPLDYLGDVSYGIYLWHLPVLLVLKAHFAVGSPASLLVWTLAIVIALSALTWHFMERPIIRRLY